MIEKLINGIYYVLVEFSDGSQIYVCTTLNSEILQKFGATLRVEFLYDLENKKYWKFRRDATRIYVFDSIDKISEVTRFVSLFK